MTENPENIRALSSIVSRLAIAQSIGKSFNGNRDIYTSLGYPTSLSFTDYNNKYKRQDIAKRIIEAPVTASWKRKPEIVEKDKPDDGQMTPFEEEWIEFEKEHKVYHYLSRGDKLAGIGRYAVVLLGFDDGQELSMPIDGNKRQLLYMRPYSEGSATVDSWETDSKDPRYGKPKLYKIKVTINKDTNQTQDITVHHSRIIHITDGALEDDIYGTPRLQSVYNRLENLEILTGGSAEMFWRGAFPGLSFGVEPEFDGDTIDTDDFNDEVEKYLHGLQRYMRLEGITIKELATQVADPTNHIDAQIKMICISKGIPKRILEGSERGELSSSQDSVAWNDAADERRSDFIDPWILRPFIDKMMEYGVIGTPAKGYDIFWPDLQLASDKDRAEVARIRTEAISKYTSSPGTDTFMPPEKFLKYIMEMDSTDIEDIIDAMTAAIEEEEAEQMEMERIAREEEERMIREAETRTRTRNTPVE